MIGQPAPVTGGDPVCSGWPCPSGASGPRCGQSEDPGGLAPASWRGLLVSKCYLNISLIEK
jgi:hypothetical protein